MYYYSGSNPAYLICSSHLHVHVVLWGYCPVNGGGNGQSIVFSVSDAIVRCSPLSTATEDKLNIANYRPISILPVISKVYEKVFYSRLYDYFSTNNILSSSQFSFRSGASTEHALLKFTDYVLKYFDDNKVGIATFIDLSKAYDCVDHKILLTKIKRYVSIQHLYDGSVVTFPTGNTLYPGIRSIQHH